DYFWAKRKRLSDEALARIIHDPEVMICVLYSDGSPESYLELDFRSMPQVERSVPGLIPEHIGCAMGSFMLREAILTAWSHKPGRLIVQTCTLDHRRALPLYQRMGFTPCGQEEVELEEPD